VIAGELQIEFFIFEMEFHGISLSNGYRDRLDASDGCLMCLLLLILLNKAIEHC